MTKSRNSKAACGCGANFGKPIVLIVAATGSKGCHSDGAPAVLLPANTDGIADADLFKRLVPFEDAFLDERSVFVRDIVFNPPGDLLLWR